MSGSLADQLLPNFQFSERHAGSVPADGAAVRQAVMTLTSEEDPFVRRCLQLREAPARLALRLGLSNGLREQPRFGLHAFTLLGDAGACELAYGLIGRFWRADFGLRPCIDAETFRNFDEPGTARLLLYFHGQAQPDGSTLLRTETRVYCPDRISRLLFTPYWLAIRPVSGLIRRRMLADVRRRLQPV